MPEPSSSSSSSSSEAHVHVVEIPVNSETSAQHKAEDDQQALIAAHPLMEISESPGHLLLLKLFDRQEQQLGHQMGVKETRLDSLKLEAFFLSSLFFAFHGLLLTLLYASSTAQADDARACRNWWIPCCLSLLTSAVLVLSVQANVWSYWRALGGLQRDRSDARALTRCVQELRMKGSSFDLSKEPQVSRRMKSSSVEIEWRPLRWLKRYVVSICLVAVAGLVAPVSKFILCY